MIPIAAIRPKFRAMPRKSAFEPIVLSGTKRAATHEVFGDDAGEWIEEALNENGVQDAAFSNASSPPNGWGIIPGVSISPSVSFARVSASRGKLTISGNATGDFYYRFGNGQNLAISEGDNLIGSMAVRLSGGSLDNTSGLSLMIFENDASGVIANYSPVPSVIQLLQTDKPFWEQARIVAGNYAFATFGLKFSAAGAFNIQLEIAWPQLEKRPWRSQFAVTSRAADDRTHSLPAGDWSIDIVADAPRFQSAGTLWEGTDGSDRITLRHQNYQFFLTVVSGGVTLVDTAVARIPALMRFEVTLAKKSSGVAVSFNGKSAIEAAITPPNVLLGTLGNGAAGYWNSSVVSADIMPAALASADLAVKSAGVGGLFDDFDRADTTVLGSPPMGPVWTQTGPNTNSIVGNKLVAQDNGEAAQAAYAYVHLGSAPRYIGALIDFVPGNTGGALAFLAGTDVPPNTFDAFHSVFGDALTTFQTLTGGVVDPAIALYAYSTAIAADGNSQYCVASLIGGGAEVKLLPDGAFGRIANADFEQKSGPYVIFEHFWKNGECRPEFSAVGAQ